MQWKDDITLPSREPDICVYEYTLLIPPAEPALCVFCAASTPPGGNNAPGGFPADFLRTQKPELTGSYCNSLIALTLFRSIRNTGKIAQLGRDSWPANRLA